MNVELLNKLTLKLVTTLNKGVINEQFKEPLLELSYLDTLVATIYIVNHQVMVAKIFEDWGFSLRRDKELFFHMIKLVDGAYTLYNIIPEETILALWMEYSINEKIKEDEKVKYAILALEEKISSNKKVKELLAWDNNNVSI